MEGAFRAREILGGGSRGGGAWEPQLDDGAEDEGGGDDDGGCGLDGGEDVEADAAAGEVFEVDSVGVVGAEGRDDGAAG